MPDASVIVCPYCGKGCAENDMTLEHIIPRAVGGSDDFAIKVCKGCQAKSNRIADERMVRNWFVVAERHRNLILDRRGRIPSLSFGNGSLAADEEEIKARLSLTPEGWDVAAFPRVDIKGGRLCVSADDYQRVLEDVKRKVEREGGKLVIESSEPRTIENLWIECGLSFSVWDLTRSFVKIALGAAFFVLGEAYLSDPHIDLLRKAAFEPDDERLPQIPLHGSVWPHGDVSNAQIHEVLGRPPEHLVLLIRVGETLACQIILFGKFSGVMEVSPSACKYALTLGNGIAIRNDPVARTISRVPYHDFIVSICR